MKKINIEGLLGALPDLSSVEAKGVSEPFKGCPFRLSWEGHWSTRVADEVIARKCNEYRDEVTARRGTDPKSYSLKAFDTIDMDSPIGPIALEKAIAKRWTMDGKLEGDAECIHFKHRDADEQEKRLFRTYVTCSEKLSDWIWFPAGYDDDLTGARYSSALLPLHIKGASLDVYFVKEAPYLIIESSDGALDEEKFVNFSNATRFLLTYLTGVPFYTAFCNAVLTETTEADGLLEARWYSGRMNKAKRSAYRPIPSSCSELQAAESMLNPDIISTCIEKYYDRPALWTPLEYLIWFPEAPLEIRGALLSLALESLTAQIQKDDPIRTEKPLEDAQWKDLQDRLLACIADASNPLTFEQRTILESRIRNLNDPTNQGKLTRPFDALDVPLSEGENKAIKQRNKLIHRGQLMDPYAIRDDRDEWKSVYKLEMQLYTALNKLLLKYLGYSGALIDWGKMSINSSTHIYDRL